MLMEITERANCKSEILRQDEFLYILTIYHFQSILVGRLLQLDNEGGREMDPETEIEEATATIGVHESKEAEEKCSTCGVGTPLDWDPYGRCASCKAKAEQS